ncbi:MAG TPA: hypothetical protein VF668_22465 [Pyrinomonadaceae bacterium]|jgi:hypothetical protein
MSANELINLILGDSARIATAISTGAQWEIWMQVELAVLFRGADMMSSREVPYPEPNDGLRLDLLVADKSGSRYAIEMKVESATNSGRAILAGLQKDKLKIAAYSVNRLAGKWVVGVAYSGEAKTVFRELALQDPSKNVTDESNGVGVVVMAAS